MLTIEQAKERIERLLPLQEKQEREEKGYIFPCPRCGHNRMHRKLVLNALSRYAHIYICEACGMDEGLRVMIGSPLPLNEWGMVLGEGTE